MGRKIAPEQIALLEKTGASRLVVLYDGDEPGRSGTETIVPILAQTFYVLAPEVPDGFKPYNADEDLIHHLLAS